MVGLLARLLAVSLAVTVGALIVVAFFAPPAHAQNAARGAVLYRSCPASCADCHNADPRLDQYRNEASGGVRGRHRGGIGGRVLG